MKEAHLVYCSPDNFEYLPDTEENPVLCIVQALSLPSSRTYY